MRKALKRAGAIIVALAAGIYIILLAGVWASQDRLMFGRRTSEIVANPSSQNWAYEDVWLDVAGGRTHGWWIPLEQARGTVLFSHGSGRNVSGYLQDAAFFRELGFSVLMYDYGGYGLSTGEPSEARCCADARAMWDHLVNARQVPPTRIVLAGSSMGGGVTADLAAQVSPAAVILESTFTSVPDVVSYSFPFIPAYWICHIQFRNIDKVGGFRCPVLIVHSKDDTVVPFSQSQELFERAAAPKMFLEIHGAHYGGKFASRDTYMPGLKEFLSKYVHLAESGVAQDETAAAHKNGVDAVHGEIVLARASHEWMSQQIEEPCILPNPKVPGRLVMFYSAVPASNRVFCAVGKAWADAKAPFVWHQDEANPVFRPSPPNPSEPQGWDSTTIRLDSVLYVPEEDAYYIYYSGSKRDVQDRVGLAVCPAGADGYSDITEDKIVRYGSEPVLAPEAAAPFCEEMASQAAVMREWNEASHSWNWFMYYSYRGKDGVLPGIRLATSSDGKTWTRHFNDADPRGMGQIFESTPNAYYEWHQILKVDDTYVLCIEAGVEHGARWRPGLAVSKDPVNGWRQLDLDTMLQTRWQGLYDDTTLYHVATPALYLIEGKWYLFAQACGRPGNDNYIDGAWEMWAMDCDLTIPTFPGYASLNIPGATVPAH